MNKMKKMKKVIFSILSIVVVLVILVFSLRIYNDYKCKDTNALKSPEYYKDVTNISLYPCLLYTSDAADELTDV